MGTGTREGKERVKVAFITPGAYVLPSSMGGSVERVVEKMVPHIHRSVQARIYGRKGKGLASSGTWRGVPIERYPAASKARYLASVCRSLRRIKPDIIQIENRPLWVPRFKKQFPASKVWLNLHSTTFIGKPYLSPAQRRSAFRAADRIVVNSEYLRSYIDRNNPHTGHKIRANHLGVDAARFPDRTSDQGARLRRQLRMHKGWQNRLVVLYVGRLIKQKGVHHLLAALPALVARHPNMLLVIVGSAFYGSSKTTAYTRSLHRFARPWRKNVHFEPYVPHTRIPDWFAMADIAVVPSIGREAFGLVNVEAMAAGLPVVATNAGGIKEIVQDGTTGYLVSRRSPLIVSQLVDRISHLLEHASLRSEMGAKGRERVMNHFLWSHTAKRWLDLSHE